MTETQIIGAAIIALVFAVAAIVAHIEDKK